MRRQSLPLLQGQWRSSHPAIPKRRHCTGGGTFIGRPAKGFDFLGYRLSPKGLAVAKQTLERFAERAARLQERERVGRASSGALGAYVRRWQRWVTAGLATSRDARDAAPNWVRKGGETWGPLGPTVPPCAVGRRSASADDSHDDQAKSD